MPTSPADTSVVSLRTRVALAVHAALPAEAGLTVDEVEAGLSLPPNPELGDLAFGCFKLARSLRKGPPAIAREVAALVPTDGVVASAEAAGPYVNLRLHMGQAAGHLLPGAVGGAPAFPPRDLKVMVEYSQPNTHKAFHVGHMRNLCLGDALARLLRTVGYEVVAANYFGDVGTHVSKCLWYYLDELSEVDREPPATARGEWLGQVYARASDALEAVENAGKSPEAPPEARARYLAVRARLTEILHAVERGEGPVAEVWRATRQWSLDEFAEIYAWSHATFDHDFYESEVSAPGLALVQEYLDRGVFVESEGAVGVVNEELAHMPFFMLRKSDGTGLYSTKDLALARLKFDAFGIGWSIYVVDTRQSDHFRHVFLTLKKMGFEQADRCQHVAYEMVELPDGPMATRTGNVVLFNALRERMTQHIRATWLSAYEGEWPPEEVDRVAHEVSLGAIRYGMLSQDVNQKIVFDMEAWMALKGNTGPYLQYTASRMGSILRKLAEEGRSLTLLAPDDHTLRACAALDEPEARQLLVALDGLPRVVRDAAEQLRPAMVCAALYDLCRLYNRWNTVAHVRASEGDVFQARLLLTAATRARLVWGLGTLGIPAPARM